MYQIVGLGNALVDSEFAVDDAVLAQTGLVKGQMTLADSQARTALFQVLHQNNIAPKKQAGGGSGANSVAVFACLGGSAYYHCRVGADRLGDFYLQDLANLGVTTNRLFAQPIADKTEHNQGNTVTGTCAVLVTQDGERTMQTHLGASCEITDKNVDFETLSSANWLYLEGYLAMNAGILPTVTTLRQQAGVQGVNIAVSFADPAVVRFAKDGLLQLLGNGVAIIFCNLEEAQLFTNKQQQKACAKALLEFAPLVVITAGAKPTVIAKKMGNSVDFLEVDTALRQVVDTNGAGDNYAGAFLYGLTESYDLKQCAALADAVAGRVVEQFGARLTKAEYLSIKQQVLG